MNDKKISNTAISQRQRSSRKKIIISSSLRSNKNLESGASYALRISRRFLMIIGISQWEESKKFSWPFVLTNTSMILCYFALGFVVIPMGLYIFMERMDAIGRIKLTGPWSFCLMATLKYFFLRSQRRQIGKCIKHIELDWSTIETIKEKNIMLEHARYGHLVTITCAIFTFSGGLFFVMLPFVVGKLTFRDNNNNDNNNNDNNNNNNNNNNTIVRQLSLPGNFLIFVVTETPIYEIVYAIQIIATFIMHSIALTCYSLAVVIVMHSCGQLKIIMENIEKLVNENEEKLRSEIINEKISDIIRRHVRALRLISSAERMLRQICLVELGGGTLNMCFLGYFTLLEWESDVSDPIAMITFVILFSSFTFNIFSFCYIGQLLTSQGEKVGETTYMTDWYRIKGKKSRDLCLIIAMTQKPVTLTAGGAIKLSYDCFTNVVKTSLGYLNMLRAVMD